MALFLLRSAAAISNLTHQQPRSANLITARQYFQLERLIGVPLRTWVIPTHPTTAREKSNIQLLHLSMMILKSSNNHSFNLSVNVAHVFPSIRTSLCLFVGPSVCPSSFKATQ